MVRSSTSRQSCAWAGFGAMATASVAAASQPLPDSLRRATPRPARNNSPPLCCGSNKFRESDTYARLDSRAAHALVAVLGRGVTRRKRLCFIRATARPRTASHHHRGRSTSGSRRIMARHNTAHHRRPRRPHRNTAPHRRHSTASPQRRAWPGRGANKAQAPAVDGLAAQRRLRRDRFMLAKTV